MTNLETIHFAQNWNNKLECDCYTTVRVRNDDKYIVGKSYDVQFRNKTHHEGTLIHIRHMMLNQVNEFIANIDMGCSLDEFIRNISNLYGAVDFNTAEISLLLIKKARTSSRDKIALFCKYYEEHTKVKYKASVNETGMIKNVKVDDLLLKTYFQCTEWWASIKSITYYVRNYNQIRVLAYGDPKKKTKAKYPDYWSAKFEKTLPTHELTEYWAYLRSIGLKPIYYPNTTTVKDWIKKDE